MCSHTAQRRSNPLLTVVLMLLCSQVMPLEGIEGNGDATLGAVLRKNSVETGGRIFQATTRGLYVTEKSSGRIVTLYSNCSILAIHEAGNGWGVLLCYNAQSTAILCQVISTRPPYAHITRTRRVSGALRHLSTYQENRAKVMLILMRPPVKNIDVFILVFTGGVSADTSVVFSAAKLTYHYQFGSRLEVQRPTAIAWATPLTFSLERLSAGVVMDTFLYLLAIGKDATGDVGLFIIRSSVVAIDRSNTDRKSGERSNVRLDDALSSISVSVLIKLPLDTRTHQHEPLVTVVQAPLSHKRNNPQLDVLLLFQDSQTGVKTLVGVQLSAVGQLLDGMVSRCIRQVKMTFQALAANISRVLAKCRTQHGEYTLHGQSSKNTHLQLEPISIFFDTQEADLDSSPVVRKFRITPPRVIGQEDDVTHHPWQRLFSMESFIARRFEDTTVVVIATSQCMILKGVLLTNATTGASQLEIFEMSSLDIAPGDGRVLKVDFSPSGHDISVTVKGRMSNIRSTHSLPLRNCTEYASCTRCVVMTTTNGILHDSIHCGWCPHLRRCTSQESCSAAASHLRNSDFTMTSWITNSTVCYALEKSPTLVGLHFNVLSKTSAFKPISTPGLTLLAVGLVVVFVAMAMCVRHHKQRGSMSTGRLSVSALGIQVSKISSSAMGMPTVIQQEHVDGVGGHPLRFYFDQQRRISGSSVTTNVNVPAEKSASEKGTERYTECTIGMPIRTHVDRQRGVSEHTIVSHIGGSDRTPEKRPGGKLQAMSSLPSIHCDSISFHGQEQSPVSPLATRRSAPKMHHPVERAISDGPIIMRSFEQQRMLNSPDKLSRDHKSVWLWPTACHPRLQRLDKVTKSVNPILPPPLDLSQFDEPRVLLTQQKSLMKFFAEDNTLEAGVVPPPPLDINQLDQPHCLLEQQKSLMKYFENGRSMDRRKHPVIGLRSSIPVKGLGTKPAVKATGAVYDWRKTVEENFLGYSLDGPNQRSIPITQSHVDMSSEHKRPKARKSLSQPIIVTINSSSISGYSKRVEMTSRSLRSSRFSRTRTTSMKVRQGLTLFNRSSQQVRKSASLGTSGKSKFSPSRKAPPSEMPLQTNQSPEQGEAGHYLSASFLSAKSPRDLSPVSTDISVSNGSTNLENTTCVGRKRNRSPLTSDGSSGSETKSQGLVSSTSKYTDSVSDCYHSSACKSCTDLTASFHQDDVSLYIPSEQQSPKAASPLASPLPSNEYGAETCSVPRDNSDTHACPSLAAARVAPTKGQTFMQHLLTFTNKFRRFQHAPSRSENVPDYHVVPSRATNKLHSEIKSKSASAEPSNGSAENCANESMAADIMPDLFVSEDIFDDSGTLFRRNHSPSLPTIILSLSEQKSCGGAKSNGSDSSGSSISDDGACEAMDVRRSSLSPMISSSLPNVCDLSATMETNDWPHNCCVNDTTSKLSSMTDIKQRSRSCGCYGDRSKTARLTQVLNNTTSLRSLDRLRSSSFRTFRVSRVRRIFSSTSSLHRSGSKRDKSRRPSIASKTLSAPKLFKASTAGLKPTSSVRSMFSYRNRRRSLGVSRPSPTCSVSNISPSAIDIGCPWGGVYLGHSPSGSDSEGEVKSKTEQLPTSACVPSPQQTTDQQSDHVVQVEDKEALTNGIHGDHADRDASVFTGQVSDCIPQPVDMTTAKVEQPESSTQPRPCVQIDCQRPSADDSLPYDSELASSARPTVEVSSGCIEKAVQATADQHGDLASITTILPSLSQRLDLPDESVSARHTSLAQLSQSSLMPLSVAYSQNSLCPSVFLEVSGAPNEVQRTKSQVLRAVESFRRKQEEHGHRSGSYSSIVFNNAMDETPHSGFVSFSVDVSSLSSSYIGGPLVVNEVEFETHRTPSTEALPPSPSSQHQHFRISPLQSCEEDDQSCDVAPHTGLSAARDAKNDNAPVKQKIHFLSPNSALSSTSSFSSSQLDVCESGYARIKPLTCPPKPPRKKSLPLPHRSPCIPVKSHGWQVLQSINGRDLAKASTTGAPTPASTPPQLPPPLPPPLPPQLAPLPQAVYGWDRVRKGLRSLTDGNRAAEESSKENGGHGRPPQSSSDHAIAGAIPRKEKNFMAIRQGGLPLSTSRNRDKTDTRPASSQLRSVRSVANAMISNAQRRVKRPPHTDRQSDKEGSANEKWSCGTSPDGSQSSTLGTGCARILADGLPVAPTTPVQTPPLGHHAHGWDRVRRGLRSLSTTSKASDLSGKETSPSGRTSPTPAFSSGVSPPASTSMIGRTPPQSAWSTINYVPGPSNSITGTGRISPVPGEFPVPESDQESSNYMIICPSGLPMTMSLTSRQGRSNDVQASGCIPGKTSVRSLPCQMPLPWNSMPTGSDRFSPEVSPAPSDTSIPGVTSSPSFGSPNTSKMCICDKAGSDGMSDEASPGSAYTSPSLTSVQKHPATKPGQLIAPARGEDPYSLPWGSLSTSPFPHGAAVRLPRRSGGVTKSQDRPNMQLRRSTGRQSGLGNLSHSHTSPSASSRDCSDSDCSGCSPAEYHDTDMRVVHKKMSTILSQMAYGKDDDDRGLRRCPSRRRGSLKKTLSSSSLQRLPSKIKSAADHMLGALGASGSRTSSMAFGGRRHRRKSTSLPSSPIDLHSGERRRSSILFLIEKPSNAYSTSEDDELISVTRARRNSAHRGLSPVSSKGSECREDGLFYGAVEFSSTDISIPSRSHRPLSAVPSTAQSITPDNPQDREDGQVAPPLDPESRDPSPDSTSFQMRLEKVLARRPPLQRSGDEFGDKLPAERGSYRQGRRATYNATMWRASPKNKRRSLDAVSFKPVVTESIGSVKEHITTFEQRRQSGTLLEETTQQISKAKSFRDTASVRRVRRKTVKVKAAVEEENDEALTKVAKLVEKYSDFTGVTQTPTSSVPRRSATQRRSAYQKEKAHYGSMGF